MLSEIIVVLLLGIIELVLYIFLKPSSTSLFTLIWILIFLIGLISSVFSNRFKDESLQSRFKGGFGDVSRYEMHVDSMLESSFNEVKSIKEKEKLRCMDSVTYLYLVLLIINIYIFFK